MNTPSSFDLESARPTVHLTAAQKHLLQTLNDQDFLEHDVFAMFEKTMERMWDWYHVSKAPASPEATISPARPASRASVASGGDERLPFASEDDEDQDKHLSKAAKALHRVWHTTLATRDRVSPLPKNVNRDLKLDFSGAL